MKKIILIAILSMFSFIGYAQIEGPPTPPPCPTMQMVTFCFTNSTVLMNCEKTICMTFTPKPNKQAELAGCYYDPNAYCITLAPGSNGCINIPSPGTPITDWYDLTVSIRSNNSGATPTFALQPQFLNSSGGVSISPDATKSGGCAQSGTTGDTRLFTTDGYNYVIENMVSLGTGG